MINQDIFESIPKYDEFIYWFKRISSDNIIYFLASDPTKILGDINITDDESNIDSIQLPADVKSDFLKFCKRPEYEVGIKVNLNTSSISANNSQYMIDSFESKILGATFIRALNAKRNPDSVLPSVLKFIEWLRNTDFYSCPGSTRFHDAEPHGLLFHSLNVYNNILEMKKLDKFENIEYHSLTLISLCHDFTKIGNYESYMKNVKNDDTGQWEKVLAFRWKCNPFPFGHGVASMYIITQFFKLSLEEMLAIRWHMGDYNVSEREEGELQDACELYPMVRMLQFADQLACVKY